METTKNDRSMRISTLPALPAALTSSTGWLLTKASQHAVDSLERALAPYGLLFRHYGVLALLRDAGPMSQQSIGNFLQIDRTTMVAVIDTLEERQLARRRRELRDRRMYAVELTDAGLKQLKRLDTIVAQVDADLARPLPAGEQVQLNELLRTLIKAIDGDVSDG